MALAPATNSDFAPHLLRAGDNVARMSRAERKRRIELIARDHMKGHRGINLMMLGEEMFEKDITRRPRAETVALIRQAVKITRAAWRKDPATAGGINNLYWLTGMLLGELRLARRDTRPWEN